MESTCTPNRIQVSYATATQIEKLGKGKWITKRTDRVDAKGLGSLETFWLDPTLDKAYSSVELQQGNEEEIADAHSRLVDWVVETLLDKLRKIVAVRRGLFRAQSTTDSDLVYHLPKGRTCLDEVREKMVMPGFDPNAAAILASVKPYTVEIDPAVVEQLRQFVTILSTLYRPNPFHNWEHAAHVTLATAKFLNRILDSDGDSRTLHEYTHGLTSDPLMLMAIILSAVIHDADHQGVR
jgi:3'5'-cyclic nucleotide phosphodiesterase